MGRSGTVRYPEYIGVVGGSPGPDSLKLERRMEQWRTQATHMDGGEDESPLAMPTPIAFFRASHGPRRAEHPNCCQSRLLTKRPVSGR